MRFLIWLVVAAPVVGFSIGCMLPGCGELQAPDEPAVGATTTDFGTLDSPVDASDPVEESGTTAGTAETGAETGAIATTGDTGPLVITCGEADTPPTLELQAPDEVVLDYSGQACSGDPAAHLGLRYSGLWLGNALDLRYRLVVGKGDPIEGRLALSSSCDNDGTTTATLALGLPKKADGEEVTLEVTVVAPDGTEVRDRATFVARVDD